MFAGNSCHSGSEYTNRIHVVCVCVCVCVCEKRLNKIWLHLVSPRCNWPDVSGKFSWLLISVQHVINTVFLSIPHSPDLLQTHTTRYTSWNLGFSTCGLKGNEQVDSLAKFYQCNDTFSVISVQICLLMQKITSCHSDINMLCSFTSKVSNTKPTDS